MVGELWLLAEVAMREYMVDGEELVIVVPVCMLCMDLTVI